MALTKLEQETILNFNNEEELAEVETPIKKLQNQLEKMGAILLNTREFENITFKVYQFPKDWLIFQKPKKKVVRPKVKTKTGNRK